MNKVFMVGRLASDPQQFVTQNGITQSRISIATSDNWNKNETYFFPCVAWQTTANFINTYLKKGDLVAVDGKLIRRSYISKEGKTVYVIEIVVETIKPLSSSKNNNTYNNPSSMDENFKTNYEPKNNVQDNVFTNNETNLENKNYEEVKTVISEQITSDDPFSLNNNENDDSDEVVNLDWLKDFSAN